MNLYISIKESEEVIFKKILFIPKNRELVKQAQGLFSVKIQLCEDFVIQSNDFFILFSSSIISFEIPPLEYNLFVNHYRLPKGLIRTKKRDVRDSYDENSQSNSDLKFNYDLYLKIRNGFLGVYYIFLDSEEINRQYINSFLTSFSNLSDFEISFIKNVSSYNNHPELEFLIDNENPIFAYRIAWLGKFLKDNLLDTNSKNSKDSDEARFWIKNFILNHDENYIFDSFHNMPKLLEKEKNIISGYILSILGIDINILSNNFNHSEYSIIIIWKNFFDSMFNNKLVYLYFISNLNKDIFTIESYIYSRFCNESTDFENLILKFYTGDNIINDYYAFFDNNLSNRMHVDLNNLTEITILDNNIDEYKIQTIGLELNEDVDEYFYCVNYIRSLKYYYRIQLNNNVDVSDITFYLDKNSKSYTYVKNLKIKVKSIEKLIDSKKKVLLQFVDFNLKSDFTNLYSNIIKYSNIKKLVTVLLVDKDTEFLHSTEFLKIRNEIENTLKIMFPTLELETIVKSKKINDTTEVVRSLKNSIGNLKLNEIEVINQNFTKEYLEYIISSSNEFYIKNDNFNYYSNMNTIENYR